MTAVDVDAILRGNIGLGLGLDTIKYMYIQYTHTCTLHKCAKVNDNSRTSLPCMALPFWGDLGLDTCGDNIYLAVYS